MLLLMLLSCANGIFQLYEQERAAVLAEPSPLGSSWDPELRVRLSDAALDDLASAAVKAGLLALDEKFEVEGPLGVTAQISPTVAVRSLALSAGKGCEACLTLKTELEGEAKWKLGSLKGTVPFSADLKGDLAFTLQKDGQTWKATGRVKGIDKIKVKAGKSSELDLGPILDDWANEITERIPELDLGSFGGEDLPLRGLRLAIRGGALSLEGVTDVVGGKAIGAEPAALDEGWEMAVSTETALAMMRRAAFEMGAIAYEVAADPRALKVAGDRFTLDLRLWKLARRGWWRDYEVTGVVEVTPRKIKLVPKNAREGETSDGAGLADPLALLAEGQILAAVEDGLAQTLPGQETIRAGGLEFKVATREVDGRAGLLFVRGELTTTAASGSSDEKKGDKGDKGGRDKRRERAVPTGAR